MPRIRLELDMSDEHDTNKKCIEADSLAYIKVHKKAGSIVNKTYAFGDIKANDEVYCEQTKAVRRVLAVTVT